MATVNMTGSPLVSPSILFNELFTSIPVEVRANIPPQLFPPKPLLRHSVEFQSLTGRLSWSQSPPVAGIQTQTRDPSSLPKLPQPSAPIRDYGASCPPASRSRLIVPPAVQHLESHLLKKHLGNRNHLPAIVNTQEAFNQLVSNSWTSRGQGSGVCLPEDLINPEQREKLKEYFKKRFTQQQGEWSLSKLKLSLDLGPTEDNYGTSCPSAQTDKSSQLPQSVWLKGLEMFHLWRAPCKGRAVKDLSRSLEGSLGKVIEAVSETEMKTC